MVNIVYYWLSYMNCWLARQLQTFPIYPPYSQGVRNAIKPNEQMKDIKWLIQIFLLFILKWIALKIASAGSSYTALAFCERENAQVLIHSSKNLLTDKVQL